MNNNDKFHPGFRSCENKGFQMTFANGWTVSVQYGKANYCDRRSDTSQGKPETDAIVASANAECAAWDSTGDWMHMSDCDDEWVNIQVLGWQTPDQVAALITRVAAFPVGSDVLDAGKTCTDIPVNKG